MKRGEAIICIECSRKGLVAMGVPGMQLSQRQMAYWVCVTCSSPVNGEYPGWDRYIFCDKCITNHKNFHELAGTRIRMHFWVWAEPICGGQWI